MEELTTKMHSEFQVNDETDKKHKVWALLRFCNLSGKAPEDVINSYEGITLKDVNKYQQSYLDLYK